MPDIFDVIDDFMQENSPEDYDYLYEIETEEDFKDFIDGK